MFKKLFRFKRKKKNEDETGKKNILTINSRRETNDLPLNKKDVVEEDKTYLQDTCFKKAEELREGVSVSLTSCKDLAALITNGAVSLPDELDTMLKKFTEEIAGACTQFDKIEKYYDKAKEVFDNKFMKTFKLIVENVTDVANEVLDIVEGKDNVLDNVADMVKKTGEAVENSGKLIQESVDCVQQTVESVKNIEIHAEVNQKNFDYTMASLKLKRRRDNVENRLEEYCHLLKLLNDQVTKILEGLEDIKSKVELKPGAEHEIEASATHLKRQVTMTDEDFKKLMINALVDEEAFKEMLTMRAMAKKVSDQMTPGLENKKAQEGTLLEAATNAEAEKEAPQLEKETVEQEKETTEQENTTQENTNQKPPKNT